jgi:hypothetical protein
MNAPSSPRSLRSRIWPVVMVGTFAVLSTAAFVAGADSHDTDHRLVQAVVVMAQTDTTLALPAAGGQ